MAAIMYPWVSMTDVSNSTSHRTLNLSCQRCNWIVRVCWGRWVSELGWGVICVSTVSGRVRQYPGGCWLELLLLQLGLKLANLPPLSPSLSLSLSLSGDQLTIEQITETTRRLNLSNRWKFMANHQCVAVVRIERIVVNSADPPCCEISLCYQWDVPIYYPWDRFVRLFINLSAAIGLPRGPISAQSRLLPWMTHFQPTPHWCLITGLERVLLEMIQLPPKLRACHLQGVQGWQN